MKHSKKNEEGVNGRIPNFAGRAGTKSQLLVLVEGKGFCFTR